MRIDVFTIFPDVVDRLLRRLASSGAPAEAGAVDVRVHDLRAGADDPRRSVDDSPFGGGAGMVLAARAGLSLRRSRARPAPADVPARTGRAALRPGRGGPQLAAAPGGFSLLCGRYEGVDQRVADHLVDGELSVGRLRARRAARWPRWSSWRRWPACCPASRQRRSRPWTRASPTGCSSTRSTPARPTSGAGRCPRCCARATTARVAALAPGPGPAAGRSSAGPTSSRPAGSVEERRCSALPGDA